MFLWKVLSIFKTWSIDVNFIVAIVSSTYLFHGVMYSINLGSSVLSNSSINIPAITGPKGDSIATPSHCWYISLLNVKCAFYKTPAVPYFSILNRLKSQSYLIFAFWTIADLSRTLVVPYFIIFKQFKTPAVPYFSILYRLSSQPYLFFAFWTIEDPRRTLALLYFRLYNNIRPQPYLVLAFQIA